MTREELRKRILSVMNDSPTSPVYWSLDEVSAMIQDGQEVITEEQPYVKRTFMVPRRPGTSIYRIPAIHQLIMAPTRIWLPDLHRRLQVVSFADLDARQLFWWTVVGDPWWVVPVTWDSFLIWPGPAASGGWLEIDAYCWPEPLMDDGDTPELHPSSDESLVLYGEFLGHLKEWDAQGAVAALQEFMRHSGHVDAQESVNQVQGRFWARGQARGDTRGGTRGDF